MLGQPDLRSRFATTMQSASNPRLPSVGQLLVAGGLIALGIWLGGRLFRSSQTGTLTARRSAPRHEVDRWANEGGAVAPASFPKPKPTA